MTIRQVDRSMKWNIARLAALLLATALAGCGGLKQQFGLDQHQAPDEFLVTQVAPLTVPPVFDLPPPGAAVTGQPGVPTADKQAANILLGSGQANAGPEDPADAALLKQAGASPADVGVRALLDSENTRRQQAVRPSLLDRLLGRKPQPAEPVVDPKLESTRPTGS